MTNILNTLAVMLATLAGAAAFSGSALANPDSPFYPGQFNGPSLSHQSPVGSGVPLQYRLGQ